MRKVTVVIPIYQAQPEALQIISLRQCFTILKRHPFSLVFPAGLNVIEYERLAAEHGIELDLNSFEKDFFTSIGGYNSLLLSAAFYQSFLLSEFILIYQTDAFVFKDELEEWCRKNLDYIGAPWFMPLKGNEYTHQLAGVGNGGFSLRNTASALRLLHRIKKLRSLRTRWYKSKLQSLLRFNKLLKFIGDWYKIKSLDNIHCILFYEDTNEDHYWSEIIATTFADFKIANADEAARFSFEVNASWLYAQNAKQLPFGCHAWEKYEPDFWKQHIKAFSGVAE